MLLTIVLIAAIMFSRSHMPVVHAANDTNKEENAINEFLSENKDKLLMIQERYPIISYSIGNDSDFPYAYEQGNKQTGIYHRMFSYFGEILDITFKQVEATDYQTAIAMLEKNEIQLLTGLVFLCNDNLEMIESDLVSDSRRISFSRKIDDNKAILIGTELEEDYTPSLISTYYWGVEELLLPLVTGTILDGCTIGYNTLEEAIYALHGNEIQGLLIKEKNYHYLVDKLLSCKPIWVTDTTYQLEEHFTYCSDNKELNDVLDELITLYLNFNDIQEIETKSASAFGQFSENTIHVIKIGTFLIVLLISILLIYYCYHATRIFNIRKLRFRSLEQKLPLSDMKDYEILHIDLRRGKINSNKHFAIFGLKRMKSKLRIRELSKMTGYDFTMHYKNILIQGEEEFIEEYALYVNGVKLHMTEKGVYFDGYMVSVLMQDTFL